MCLPIHVGWQVFGRFEWYLVKVFGRDRCSVWWGVAGSGRGLNFLSVLYCVLPAPVGEQGCIGSWVGRWVVLSQWNRLHFVLSSYRCRVTVRRVWVIGLAGLNKVWFGYTWCVCQYLDNWWVDLSDMWWKCLEGVAIVCDGVWQEVGVVLIFYVFSTVHYVLNNNYFLGTPPGT